MLRYLRGIVPPTKLERDLRSRASCSAFATGSFLTGTAVFFTQIVGLTGAQIGLGMSAAAFVTLALSIPLGRLSDRVGAKRLWMVSALIEALLYLAWPLASGFTSFVILLAVLASVETAGRSARNVYRIEVFPRDDARRAPWPTSALPATSATRSAPVRRASRSASGRERRSSPYPSSPPRCC